ncbi:MAG: methylated-DNA--[Clostridia bacterium]|nr:methylated-DNA--[protein]-cysteine S-methyltransferase [Clostridia bacterium]
MNETVFDSPVGRLFIAEKDGRICKLSYYSGKAAETRESRLLIETQMQLKEYFGGVRREFDLPLTGEGSDFALAVRRELLKIPYGTTRTYSEIAAAVGKPGAARAVGMACHNNPIAIIIPCHRVVGVNANLVGYAGGVEKKEYLLRLEHAIF